MTTTPNFDDLSPPDEMVECWSPPGQRAITLAYRAGARHGWEQARQLWPEPITDRPPTEADGDDDGWVQMQSPLDFCPLGCLKKWIDK
jgi:hypothetical protein